MQPDDEQIVCDICGTPMDEYVHPFTAKPVCGLCAFLDPPPLDNVILAYQAFRGPLPEPGPPTKLTMRQRIRIWRRRRREQLEQWIHDHLQHARCDN